MTVETFGRFTIRRPIARGGMAEVYEAVRHGAAGFERRVALKLIRREVALDARFIGMFIDEAKVAARLGHANINRVIDFGCIGGRYFLALDYVDGWELRDVVHRARDLGRRLPVGFVGYVIQKVAEALDYAHTLSDEAGNPLGIVHRDVSPHNILLSREGSVVLADFGLAKAAGRMSQTGTGVVKGKFGYLSPEQVAAREPDGRSDVFSLGICMWEALTLERLFGSDPKESIARLARGRYPSAATVRDDLPPDMEELLEAMLERKPERRPTAADVADRLAAILARPGLALRQADIEAFLQDLMGEVGPGWRAATGEVGSREDTAIFRATKDVAAAGSAALPAPTPAPAAAEAQEVLLLHRRRARRRRRKAFRAAGGLLALLALAAAAYATYMAR